MSGCRRILTGVALVSWVLVFGDAPAVSGAIAPNVRDSLRVYQVPNFELGWEHVAYPLEKRTAGARVSTVEDRLSADDRKAASHAMARLSSAAIEGLRRLDPLVDVIQLEAARGQVEAFSFVVESDGGAPVLQVELTDFVRSGKDGGRIESRHIDVWLVYPWLQAGRSGFGDKGVIVPELLLKTDTALKFADSYDSEGRYVPPDIRLHGPVVTSIAPGGFKRFLINARVPVDTRPGTYTGRVVILVEGTQPLMMNVSLVVEDFVLSEPRHDLLIYYDGRPEFDTEKEGLTERRFTRELAFIRGLGYRGLRIAHHPSRAQLVKAFESFRRLGFEGPIVQSTFSEDAASVATSFKYAPFFYGVDEPDSHGRLLDHVRRSRQIHAKGGQVTTAITRKGAVALANPRGWNEPLDLINYDQDQPDFWDYMRALHDRTVTRPGVREVYYWQMWVEKPDVHRLLHGFYLWKTGLDGVSPWIFGRIGSTSPYHSGDETAVEPAERGLFYREFFFVYPAQDGPVSTLSAEAVRQGINDLRLVTTLHEMIQRAGGLGGHVGVARQAAEATVQYVMSRLAWNLHTHAAKSYRAYGSMVSAEIDHFRAEIFRRTARLGDAMAHASCDGAAKSTQAPRSRSPSRAPKDPVLGKGVSSHCGDRL
jgi:hypothetical protein